VTPDGHGVETSLLALEAADRCHECRRRLLVEEDPSSLALARARALAAADDRERNDGLGRPPAPEGDDGPPRGLRLHRDDAEILILRIDQCTAARVEVCELRVRYASRELDVRRRTRCQHAARGAVACNHETPPEIAKCLDRDRLPLVGHEAAHQQVEVLWRAPVRANASDVDGRIYQRGAPLVVLLDAGGNRPRDRHEA